MKQKNPIVPAKPPAPAKSMGVAEAKPAMGPPASQATVGNNKVPSSLGATGLTAFNPEATKAAGMASRMGGFFDYFTANTARKEIKSLTKDLAENIIPRLSAAEEMKDLATVAMAKATIASKGAVPKLQAAAFKQRKSLADANVRLADRDKQKAIDKIRVLSKRVGDAEDRLVTALGLPALVGSAYSLKEGAASEDDKSKSTPMYDNDPRLKGDQDELPDFLQKKIIEDAEENDTNKTSQADPFTTMMSHKFAGLLAPDSPLRTPEGAIAAGLGGYGGYLASGLLDPGIDFAADVGTNRVLSRVRDLEASGNSAAARREISALFADQELKNPRRSLFTRNFKVPIEEQKGLIKSQLMRRYGRSGAVLSALLGGGLGLGLYNSNRLKRQAQGGGIGYGLPV